MSRSSFDATSDARSRSRSRKDHQERNLVSRSSFDARSDATSDAQMYCSSRLHVSNVNVGTSVRTILEEFERFGPVLGVMRPFDRCRNAPRSYVSVEFLHPEHAEAAIKGLNGKVIDSNHVHVRLFQILK